LATDPLSTVAKLRNHVSQLLKVHGVNDVRLTETHTAELPLPKPSAFEFEMAQ
jgi:hypothetical protein